MTLSDLSPRFQGHDVLFMPIDALSVFSAQLTRDLLAIGKFLYYVIYVVGPQVSGRIQGAHAPRRVSDGGIHYMMLPVLYTW